MFKYDKNASTAYCLGAQATFYLLDTAPTLCQRIYISPKQKRDETFSRLESIAKASHIPFITNNERIFKDLSGKDNVMVIGEFTKQESALDPNKNHVVLVNPSNMGNLGTIMRSCVGFGIHDLAIITPASDPFDPKVVRASMGAIFHLRFKRFSSFEEYQNAYMGRLFYPFMLQTETLLPNVKKKDSPFSLVFGNEATGLPESFLEIGEPVKIPQTNLVDSLNLDNAVSIALYEFLCR